MTKNWQQNKVINSKLVLGDTADELDRYTVGDKYPGGPCQTCHEQKLFFSQYPHLSAKSIVPHQAVVEKFQAERDLSVRSKLKMLAGTGS